MVFFVYHKLKRRVDKEVLKTHLIGRECNALDLSRFLR